MVVLAIQKYKQKTEISKINDKLKPNYMKIKRKKLTSN